MIIIERKMERNGERSGRCELVEIGKRSDLQIQFLASIAERVSEKEKIESSRRLLEREDYGKAHVRT